MFTVYVIQSQLKNIPSALQNWYYFSCLAETYNSTNQRTPLQTLLLVKSKCEGRPDRHRFRRESQAFFKCTSWKLNAGGSKITVFNVFLMFFMSNFLCKRFRPLEGHCLPFKCLACFCFSSKSRYAIWLGIYLSIDIYFRKKKIKL